MSQTCNHCEGTGFLNAEQLPEDQRLMVEDGEHDAVLPWLETWEGIASDVTVCDCCGDGNDAWYGTPGEHYNADDPPGKHGPYAYNRGLCECH